jgi:hypothetical protein
MTKSFSPSAHILNAQNHPQFVVGNKNPAFTGIEDFGEFALDRALTLAQKVHELETAGYTAPYPAAVRNIMANMYFQAAQVIDGIVSENLCGADAVERGHLACDAVRDLIGAAEHFQINFLSKGAFHSGSTREVAAQEEGQEPQLITLTEDLENLRHLMASAQSVLEEARIFSFWTHKSMRV